MFTRHKSVPNIGKIFLICLISLLTTVAVLAREGVPLTSATEKWLKAQASIETWEADFIQTRYLKTLTQPLIATGHVWFASPNKFRWELGKPAKTIALRSGDQMLLIYPSLKRIEKYPLGQTQSGPWRDAAALLEAGFPRSIEDIQRQFEVLSQNETNGIVHLGLRPKATASRKMLPQVVIAFDARADQLISTDLTFADGSRMHNDFANQQTNQQPPADIFSTATPEGYKVVEPAKGIK